MNSQPAQDAPEPEKPKQENPRLENPVQEKPVQENPKQEKPEQENPAQLNTNRSNTNSEKTYLPNTQGENPYPSIHPQERQEDVAAIRDSVRSQIGYDCLVTPYNRDRMDEIVELMVEILCTGRETITISGAEYPAELVRERMRKINSMHIEYIFGCLEQNASRVRNIKKYLLTTLFNAPATMGNYYDAQVRYDRRKREEDYRVTESKVPEHFVDAGFSMDTASMCWSKRRAKMAMKSKARLSLKLTGRRISRTRRR